MSTAAAATSGTAATQSASVKANRPPKHTPNQHTFCQNLVLEAAVATLQQAAAADAEHAVRRAGPTVALTTTATSTSAAAAPLTHRSDAAAARLAALTPLSSVAQCVTALVSGLKVRDAEIPPSSSSSSSSSVARFSVLRARTSPLVPDAVLDAFVSRAIADAIERLLTRYPVAVGSALSADQIALLVALPFYCARRGDLAHAQRRFAVLAWCRVLGRVSMERLSLVNEKFGSLVDSARDDDVVANLCETLVDVRLLVTRDWRAVSMFLARALASARLIKHGAGSQTTQFAAGIGGALRSLDSAALSAALASDAADNDPDALAAASIVRSLAALRQQALKWANGDVRDAPAVQLAAICLAHAPRDEFASQFETLLQQLVKGCWSQKRAVAEPSIDALHALLAGAPRAGQSPFAAQPLKVGDAAQVEERLRSVKRSLFGRRQQLPLLAEHVRRLGEIVALLAAHDLPFAVEQLLPALFADKSAQPGHAAVGIEALRIMLDTRSTFWEHASGARRSAAPADEPAAVSSADVSRTELLMLFKNVVLKCVPVCERFVGNAVLGVATASLPVEAWSGATCVDAAGAASTPSAAATGRWRSVIESTPDARLAREVDDEQRANMLVGVVVNDWRSKAFCQPVTFANAPLDAVDGVVASVKDAKQKRKLLAERDVFVALYISLVTALALVPESEFISPHVGAGAAAAGDGDASETASIAERSVGSDGRAHVRAASQPANLISSPMAAPLVASHEEPTAKPRRPVLARASSAGHASDSPPATMVTGSQTARSGSSVQSTSPRIATPVGADAAGDESSGAFIGQLLVHADPGLVRATSSTLQSTIATCPHARAAVIGGFVSLVADYSPIDTVGLLTLLRHLVALLDCWHDCILREQRTVPASEALPATTFVQLDALALIHLCSINFGVRREARNLAEALAAMAAVQARATTTDVVAPPACVADVVRQYAGDIVERARRRYLLNLVCGVPDEAAAGAAAAVATSALSLDDIAVSGMTELWVYVIAEIGHRLVEFGDADKTLNVVRKVLVIQLQNGARGPRESDLPAMRFSPTQRYLWLTYQCLFLALCGTAATGDRERKIARQLRNYLPLCFTALLSPAQGGASWITDSVATACGGSNWRSLPAVAARFARWLLTALTAANDVPRLLSAGARTLRAMLQSELLAAALQRDSDGSLELLVSSVAALTARMPALFGYKRDDAAPTRSEMSRDVFNDLALIVHYVTAASALPLPLPPAPFVVAAPRNALVYAALPAELHKCWPVSSRRALLLVAMQWSGAGRLAAYNLARERTDMQHELRKIKDDARRRQRRAEALFEIARSQRCARLLMGAVLRAGRILTREQLTDKLARDTVLDTLLGNELAGARVLRWPLAHHFERLLPHILRRCRTAALPEQTALLNALFDQFLPLLDDAPRRADGDSARPFDWRQASTANAEVYTRAVVSSAAALLRVALTCLFDRRVGLRVRAAELLNCLVPLRFGLGAAVSPTADAGAAPSPLQALARQLQAVLVGAQSKSLSVYRQNAERATAIAASHCAMFTEKLFAECVLIAAAYQEALSTADTGDTLAPAAAAGTSSVAAGTAAGAGGANVAAGGSGGGGGAAGADADGVGSGGAVAAASGSGSGGASAGVGASGGGAGSASGGAGSVAGAALGASTSSASGSAASGVAAPTLPASSSTGDLIGLAASPGQPASPSLPAAAINADDVLASLLLQLEILLPWCDNIALGGLKESTPDAFLKALFTTLTAPWFGLSLFEPPRVLFDVWLRLARAHPKNVGMLVAFLLRRSLLSKAALGASKALLLLLYRNEPLAVAQHVASVLSLSQILRTHARDGNRRASSLSPSAQEFGGDDADRSSGTTATGSARDDDMADADDATEPFVPQPPAAAPVDARSMLRRSSLSAKLVERARAALPVVVASPPPPPTPTSPPAAAAPSAAAVSPEAGRWRRQATAANRRHASGASVAQRSKQRMKEANQIREVAVTVLTEFLTDSFEPLIPHLSVIVMYAFVRAPSPNEHAIVTRLLGAVVDGARAALRARACGRAATARVEQLLAALDELSDCIDRDALTLVWDDSTGGAALPSLGASASWYGARRTAPVRADELCQVLAASIDELEAAASGDSFSVRLGGKALAWATQFRDFRHSTKALFVMRALQQPLAVDAMWALVSTLADNADILVENVVAASVNDDDAHRSALAQCREKCIELLRSIESLMRALFAAAVPNAAEAAALAFWAAAACLPRIDDKFGELFAWSVRIMALLSSNKFFFDVLHLHERRRATLIACAHERFRGVQPCLIRGLAHADTALPCAQLLASLLLVPLDALIEPSPSRAVLCVLALLPWLATHCSHRPPPPAVAEVAQLTVRNVDNVATSLRLGETKRALLWFCAGCNDVGAMLSAVCDELYSQAFRSAAPEIAAMYAMMLREQRGVATPLANTLLMCVSAFMQRADFALYATHFGAPPAPFVLAAVRQGESHEPSVFAHAASLTATDGGWSVVRLLATERGPFASVPVRRVAPPPTALDVNDLGYMPQALHKLRDERTVAASSAPGGGRRGAGAGAGDTGSVLYGGGGSDLDETTSLGTFVARSDASVDDGVSESDFTEYTFGDNMSVLDDAQGRRDEPEAKDDAPARLSSLNKLVDTRRSDDDDDDDGDDDDAAAGDGKLAGGGESGKAAAGASAKRRGSDDSAADDDDDGDGATAATIGEVLAAAASHQFPSFTSFTDDDRLSSGGSDAVSFRSIDFADLREASPTQHLDAAPSPLSFRPISPAMLFTVSADESGHSPRKAFSSTMPHGAVAVPKVRRPSRHTSSSIEIAITAAPPDSADDSEEDSELANVVSGRARSPSDAFMLPPSPPPTP